MILPYDVFCIGLSQSMLYIKVALIFCL